MSELTKTTSIFRLQLKSPAVFVSILLRLLACALGFFMAMLIDALLFEGWPTAVEPVLLVLCIFGLDYRVNQLLITDCEVYPSGQDHLEKGLTLAYLTAQKTNGRQN